MPLQRLQYDDQSDYEDPMDRLLHRGRGGRAAAPNPSSTAKLANRMGIAAMIPILGLIMTPVTFLVALLAKFELKRNPKLTGKKQVANAFLFAIVGGVINYVVPTSIILLMRLW